MVLPVLGALAGAGGSIAAALLGADAQSEANATNRYIAELNYRQRERERNDARQFADQMIRDQKLGGTDALGNRTQFVEGKGWTTELSPQQQQLYDYFLTQELPERQMQFQRAAELSKGDADLAGALLDQFRRVQRTSPKEIEALLYSQATRGMGEGMGDVTETAMRQAARTGNSNVSNILGALAGKSMEARGNARVDSMLKAKDYAEQQYDSERSGLAQLYNMFAQRAGQQLGVSYDPSNDVQGANSLMRFFTQIGQQGDAAGFKAAAMKGGTMDKVTADTGMANAAGAIGSALSGLGSGLGSYFDKQDMNSLLRSYITQGGQTSLNNGGILGMAADRLRNNSSVY